MIRREKEIKSIERFWLIQHFIPANGFQVSQMKEVCVSGGVEFFLLPCAIEQKICLPFFNLVKNKAGISIKKQREG